MAHPFSPTEARSVGEQVDVGHEVQSDSVFGHEAKSSGTASPVVYLLECAEVFLQLS